MVNDAIIGNASSGGSSAVSMTVSAFDSETSSGTANPQNRSLVYLSDGIYTCLWNGTAWEYYWQSRLIIRPRLADFPVIVKNTAVPVDSGGILITGANNAYSLRFRALPATSNWRVEAGYEYAVGDENYGSISVIVRSSATDKWHILDAGYNNQSVISLARTTGDTFEGTDKSSPCGNVGISAGSGAVFLAVEDDGTNRVFYVSQNAKHWMRFYSASRTYHTTPDQVAFRAVGSTNHPPHARLFHWKQVTI